MQNWYFGHMFGWSIFGGFMMIVFWLALILLVAWIVKELGKKASDESRHSALDVLKERYARGEIKKEEFDAKRKDLES